MNSNNDDIGNVDFFSIKKCRLCHRQISGNPKILNCLHFICENCITINSTDLGIRCECHIYTKDELTNYPNGSQVKICCEQNCDMIANKICMPCNSIYCESCSKIHLSNQQNHQSALIMTYPLEKVVCIQCIERYVEVYCTKCSEIICSLCKLKYHENHNFKIITTMANKSKFEFDIELFEIKKSTEFLNSWIERSNQTIEKLTSQKIQTYDKIDKTMRVLHNTIDKCSIQLKKMLEKKLDRAVDEINTNKEILNHLKKENDNHFDLLSILINQDETVDITKHTKYVVNRMNVNRSYTDIMEGEIVISLAYKDEQFLRNFAKLLEGVKNVISIKTDKKKLTNKALQVDEPLKSSSEIQDNMEIVENKNIVDINFDSPKFISLAICCCCNQLTNNLIHCVNCQRFYHNNCHIPPIDKDLKPNHPSLKKWNCTLCQNIETHVIALYKKDFTDYNIINNAEQKVIERILLELYCQYIYSKYYQNCLNRDQYPLYYEKINDPISLNDIKRHLITYASYISTIHALRDVQKVFKNGMSYYSPSDPEYKSAEELQIFFYRMLTNWIPNLDIACLQ